MVGDNAKFSICDGGEGENPLCNTFPPRPNVDDHREYFGIRVGTAFKPDMKKNGSHKKDGRMHQNNRRRVSNNVNHIRGGDRGRVSAMAE